MNTRAEELVKRGQRMAESLMTLTVQAFAPPTGPIELNEDGFEVRTPVAKGKSCAKVQSPSQQSDNSTRTFVVGGVPLPVLEEGLHLPIEKYFENGRLAIRAGDRGVGWEFKILTAASPIDLALVGRQFLVVGIPTKSFMTARRLHVVEVTPS